MPEPLLDVDLAIFMCLGRLRAAIQTECENRVRPVDLHFFLDTVLPTHLTSGGVYYSQSHQAIRHKTVVAITFQSSGLSWNSTNTDVSHARALPTERTAARKVVIPTNVSDIPFPCALPPTL